MSNLENGITRAFGELSGAMVDEVTLTNHGGLSARIITYGARLRALVVPDRHGNFADVVLGFDTIEQYAETETYFGATCGRYGNRIAKGRFALEGLEYQLDINEGANHLHGGTQGFDRKIWAIEELTQSRVKMNAVSDDGEMGFPGACRLSVVYELTADNELIVEMTADTDRSTLMNMVHHSYFNLAGQGSGDVLAHQIMLNGDFYTPVNSELLATGEILSVENTPFDFRTPKAIGLDIGNLQAVGAEVFLEGGGYDHNWCLNGAGSHLRLAADVYEPSSGRRMTLRTTEPGVQFYIGGYLNGDIGGKEGKMLCKYAGFTLETQKFPDAPNFAHFPSCRLDPGAQYEQTMIFKFTTNDP